MKGIYTMNKDKQHPIFESVGCEIRSNGQSAKTNKPNNPPPPPKKSKR